MKHTQKLIDALDVFRKHSSEVLKARKEIYELLPLVNKIDEYEEIVQRMEKINRDLKEACSLRISKVEESRDEWKRLYFEAERIAKAALGNSDQGEEKTV